MPAKQLRQSRKHIKMKNGKQPIVIRSKIVLSQAATRKLIPMIATLDSAVTTASADRDATGW